MSKYKSHLFERLEAAWLREADIEDLEVVGGLEGVGGPGGLHRGDAVGGAGDDQEPGTDPAL